MKLRLALLSLLGVLFWLTCNTYQPPTVLEYTIDVSWPGVTPIIFKNYSFAIHTGENKFTSIRIYSEPTGFIDSSLINRLLKNGTTVSGYFLKPGACKLFIEGLAADQRTFKDSCSFSVKNPYTISGLSQLAIEETGSFRLVPADTFVTSGLKLIVNWKENGKSPSPLNISTPFTFTVIDSGSQKVTAIIVDTVNNHSYTVDSLEFKVPGHRPFIDSLQIINTNLVAGDSLRLNMNVSDKDTTSLLVLLASKKRDTSRFDTILIPSSQFYNSLLTVKRPFIDTGSYVLTIKVIDPSGLVSTEVTRTIAITANPPVVTFNPDMSVGKVPYDYSTTLFVTGSAEIYHWSIDGIDTTTTVPQLTRNFLSAANLKDTSTVIVYGIDKYSYRGKPDTLILHKETQFYSLSFSHLPGESAFRDSAYWEVKTPNTDRAKENSAKFYWGLVRLAVGDTIYRDSIANTGDSLSRLSIKGLIIPGIALDSIDLAVSVVLRDALDTLHTSAILTNTSKIRLFRPKVRLMSPVPDSVSTDMPVTIAFKASDVNADGSIKSIFWKYADSASAHPLAPTDSMLTFTLKTAGTRTLCIWAFDNDGQISDTLKPIVNVVKNRPRITGVSLKPATVYTNDACSLSVSMQRGISGAKIDSVRWSCPTSSTNPASGTTPGPTFPASFAAPGWHRVTVTVYDSLRDSASRIDSVLIASGNPSVALLSILPSGDTISAKVTATFKYAVSTARSLTIDSVFWRQKGSVAIHGLKVAGSDSTFTNAWTDTGTVILQLWARDNLKNTSDTLIKTIWIVKSQPRVISFSMKPATVYTNEPCSLSITAMRGYSRARIDSIHWTCPTWTGPATRKTTTEATISASFATTGRHRITVTLFDSLLDSSSRVDSVNILSGKPSLSITSILPRNDSISTKVPAIFKYAVSTSRAGFVDSVFWQQAGTSVITGLKVSGSDSTFRIAWPDSGHIALRIWARDNIDNPSDTLTRNFVIVKNRPSVSAFIMPSGTPPTKRPYNYTIVPRRGFSKSPITGYHWVYPATSGAKDSVRTDSTLSLQFDTPGSKIMKVYVVDSLNDTSAIFIDTVTIDQGLPIVTSVKIDTSASGGSAIYVNDFFKVTIHAKDTNGTIAAYRAVLKNNGSGDSIVAQGPDSTLSLIVAVGHDGGYSLKVYAYDNDGLLSAAFPTTALSLQVKAAKPIITGFTPTPGQMGLLWIYDMLTFRYSARDTNGGLTKVMFDWGDGSKIDTVALSQAKDTLLNRPIPHRYVSSGTFTVTVTALDEDGQSTASSYTVTIHKGAPVVKAIQDTFSFASDFQGDTMSFAANGFDSNGTIQKYVWIVNPPLDTTAHTPDTLVTTTGAVNVSRKFFLDHAKFALRTTYPGAVYIKDDDSMVTIDTFHFYFDDPRNHFDSAFCKIGFKTNRERFEFGGPEPDSIYIDVVNIEKTDTSYLTAKTVMIIDSGFFWDSTQSAYNKKAINDTVVVNDYQKLNVAMTYIDADPKWHMAYRPLSSVFSRYLLPTPPNPLYFHFEVSIRNRAGTSITAQAFSGGGLTTQLLGLY